MGGQLKLSRRQALSRRVAVLLAVTGILVVWFLIIAGGKAAREKAAREAKHVSPRLPPRYLMVQYEGLRIGMNYPQAVAVMGGSGDLYYRSEFGAVLTEVYSWSNPDGSYCRASFRNGLLVDTTQLGLG